MVAEGHSAAAAQATHTTPHQPCRPCFPVAVDGWLVAEPLRSPPMMNTRLGLGWCSRGGCTSSSWYTWGGEGRGGGVGGSGTVARTQRREWHVAV